jgi:hypothetical protein
LDGSESAYLPVDMMRRLGGYGAAIAVTPYLLIKLAWTFGILLPDARMGLHGWRAINTTTALLALVGILLGLAFSRPWGQRLPTCWWSCRSG